jgi:hypothetical protein
MLLALPSVVPFFIPNLRRLQTKCKAKIKRLQKPAQRPTIFTMPKTKKAGKPKAARFTRADPLFFAKIGKLGGRKTKKNHDDDYFSKIATLSHRRRRERAAEAAGE